jgi:hypothetical protein
MKNPPDPELEQLKRTVDLTEYAKRAGYQPKTLDVGLRLTLLEHPNGDSIVVGQRRSGEWIYASVPDYEPRLPDESLEQARARLRASIERSKDKGTVVEFVQNRAGNDIPLDWIREHLRDFRAMGRDFDLEAAVDASALPIRDRKQPTIPIDPPQRDSQMQRPVGPSGGINPELNRRRYDWTPEPSPPNQSDAQQRLERWQKAQATMDDRLHVHTSQDRLPHPPSVPPTRSPTPKVSREAGSGTSIATGDNSALGKCRLDWTPSPSDREALDRALRNRSPGRGR